MTSRQAKHQAKRRAEGGLSISIQFRVEEPETKAWLRLAEVCGGNKRALSHLLKDYIRPSDRFVDESN